MQEVVQLFGEGETAMKPADQVQSPKFMAEVMESHCRLPQVLPGKQKSLMGRVRPRQGDKPDTGTALGGHSAVESSGAEGDTHKHLRGAFPEMWEGAPVTAKVRVTGVACAGMGSVGRLEAQMANRGFPTPITDSNHPESLTWKTQAQSRPGPSSGEPGRLCEVGPDTPHPGGTRPRKGPEGHRKEPGF